MQTLDIWGSLDTGKSTTTINLTDVHQFLPGQYCTDEDIDLSPEGIAYCERPYDITGRPIPVCNLVRPPYLPNPDSKQNVHNLRVAMLTALMVALTQSVQPLFSIEMLVVVDNMILGYHWGHFL